VNSGSEAAAAKERERLLAEYRRRETLSDRYALWRPAEVFLRTQRRRAAAHLLVRAGAFPMAGQPCLEVGYGTLGWLGELLSWGLRERDLHGIELDAGRARVAQQALPSADLRVGDATALPWESAAFRLVVVSTVFSSVLDPVVRNLLAREIERVIAPGGGLLFYDFAVNNPANDQVRGVPRGEILRLFPGLRGEVRAVTLAPPLARTIAPWSWTLATCLEAVPFLRTHLVAVLKRNE
jgi:ubiquinone/menaquinone biosynthesis C-methylase UbiE